MNNKPQINLLVSKKFELDFNSSKGDFVSKNSDISNLKEILYGIEEEGIPWNIEFVEENLIKKERSTNSILEVGVMIYSNKEVLLTSRKYDKEYIQKENLENDSMNLRALGSNSGKLVKKLPLKL